MTVAAGGTIGLMAGHVAAGIAIGWGSYTVIGRSYQHIRRYHRTHSSSSSGPDVGEEVGEGVGDERPEVELAAAGEVECAVVEEVGEEDEHAGYGCPEAELAAAGEVECAVVEEVGEE